MADELDQAAGLTAAEAAAGIERARAAAALPGPVPTGECYACGEDVPFPKLFCNAACAAEHAKARKRR